MGCNESKVQLSWNNPWYDVEWYLSEEEINDIGAAGILGGSASQIYRWLVSRGIIAATIPSGVGIVLAVVLAVFWAWILWSNSGCGVIVHVYISQSGDFQGVYVESQ